MDLIALHRRASAATAAIIDRVPADKLDAPTPCTEWTVREIVAHLVHNARSFVALAREESEVDEQAGFTEAAKVFADVFADPAVLAMPFELAGGTHDGRVVVATVFADVFVHGWDIGRAVGLDVDLDDELVSAALRITSRFPDSVRGPGAAFDYPRPAADHAPARERLLAWLGRDPGWTPAP